MNYNVLATSITFLRLINSTAKANESKKVEGDNEGGEDLVNELTTKVEKANQLLLKEIESLNVNKEEKEVIIICGMVEKPLPVKVTSCCEIPNIIARTNVDM